MNRDENLQRLKSERFDILVIGGGATGLGCALDAASRGHRTALIEAEDFAKATSSRSTKLIHGGVRYLEQGNIALVREALRERALLRANAPGLVYPLAFVVPARTVWERLYYGAGLRVYDALAGSNDFSKSAIERGGVVYWDAQFDDARLAIALATTACDRGAAITNYVRAAAFRYENGVICGVDAIDIESQERFSVAARAVVNAAGIFVDEVRRMDSPAAMPLLRYSRGSHIVVAGDALRMSGRALLVPRTSDGRVLFAIPWYGHTLVGTTEVAVDAPEIEPAPSGNEIDYILQTVNRYLPQPVSRADIRSAFAGLRPLVDRSALHTARLSREHIVDVSPNGLFTIAGGKWTTYRKMAEDTIDAVELRAGLRTRPCQTRTLPLRDETAHASSLGDSARVEYFARHEMARTLEDVLARRMRTLFVDAQAAIHLAPAYAAKLAAALGRDEAWASQQAKKFSALAAGYTSNL